MKRDYRFYYHNLFKHFLLFYYSMVYWLDFVQSPPWFYGKDLMIDIASAVIVLIIGLFALKIYFMNKENKRNVLLTGAFMILGGSFIVKSITNILTHHPKGIANYLSTMLALNMVPDYSVLPALGFLIYATLTIVGFYLLYLQTAKQTLVSTDYLVLGYFMLISVYFARFNYFLLYLSSLIFLVAITRRYFISYHETKYKNKLRLAVSFLIISLSQLFFIFATSNHLLYVVAEIIQIIGYLSLLYTFFMVLRNANSKKKK